MWNRQSIDHHELRPGDKSSRPRGSKPTRGWNPREMWEISAPGTHPALISDADFLHVQQITALPTPEDGSTDRNQLTGLVLCGLCGRRAEGHWAYGRARYRCRPHGSASDAQPGRPETRYLSPPPTAPMPASYPFLDCASHDHGRQRKPPPKPSTKREVSIPPVPGDFSAKRMRGNREG